MIAIRQPAETCPHCQGTGAEPPDQDFLPCVLCKGAGVIMVKNREKVGAIRAVPAGRQESPLRPAD
jgi:DnaJ-class molecular chaperone